MVAIFTGLGAGFERGSATTLGSNGLLGSSTQGRGGEGVFLNAATGNLLLRRQDEFLVGRGPDVGIARTYNSLGALDDNGDQWRQSTDRRVYGLTGTVNVNGSTVKRVSADGSEITYTYGAWSDGSYYRATDGDGAHDKLVASNIVSGEVGLWTWTEGSSRIVEAYGVVAGTPSYGLKVGSGASAIFYIAKQSDTDANNVTFVYSGANLARIATANDVTGQQSAIEYGWTGVNITSVVAKYTDYSGVTSVERTLTRTRYAYDASNRLITVTTDLSPEDNVVADANTYWTSYTYVGTSKRVATITQKDGSSLTLSYDGSNRITRLVQVAAGADTRTTDIIYNAGYTDIKVYTNTALTQWLTTSLYYDASKQLTKVIAPPAGAGATAQVVDYVYDSLGNVTQSLETLSSTLKRQTDFIVDLQGNVTQTKLTLLTFANSVWTSVVDKQIDRAFDANNSVTRVSQTGSTASSASATLYTRYVYDSENHLRFTIGHEGRVSEYRYTAQGLLAATIAYTDSIYSAIAPPGVPTETDMVNWRSALTLTNAQVSEYLYDARGGLTDTKTYGAAIKTGGEAFGVTGEGYAHAHFIYDQAGQLLKRYVSPNVLANAESFVYDGLGRVTASTDLAGGTTNIIFNDGATTTAVTTAANYTTISTYNKAGELITRTDSGATTAGGTTSISYDKLGRARVETDAAGAKRYFLFDNLGRKTAEIGDGGQVAEYRYDQAGRLIATIRYANVGGATQFTALADVATDAKLGAGALTVPAADNANDIWQWSVYDSAGRVIETITGDGSATAYAYDSADRLIATTGYFNKLNAGQLTTLRGVSVSNTTAQTLPTPDSRDVITRSFYDGEGRLVGALNADGYLSQIVYDSAGRKIQELGYFNATNTTLRASGTFAQLLASFALSSKDVSTRYVYDAQGQLRYTIDALSRVTEAVYWEGAGSENTAAALVRRTIAYTTPLGTVADYKYATIKSALAALVQNANLLEDGSGELLAAGSLPITSGYWAKDASGTTVIVRAPTGQQSYFDIGLGAAAAKFYSSARPVTEGQTHTVSGQNTGTGTNGAIPLRVRLEYFNASGTSIGFSAGTNLTRTGTWSSFTHTAVAPTGAASARVVFDWQGGTGPALVRDVKLEVGSNATRTYNSNLLRDSSGELNGAGNAFAGGYWATDNGAAVAVTAPSGQQSYFDVTLGAAAGNFRSAAPVPATAGQTFTVSGQSNGGGPDGIVPLRVRLFYYDSTGTYISSSAAANLTRNGAWTGFKLTATAPANTASVRVAFQWEGGSGPASIRDVKLETGAVETRWSLPAAALSDRTTYNVYNDREQLAYSIDVAGAVTAFAYDNLGRVTKTTQFAQTAIMSAMGTQNAQWKAKLDAWAGVAANSAGARITRTYYTERGEVRFVADAEGYISGRDYNALGQLIAERRYATKLTPLDAWTTSTVLGLNKGAAISTTYSYDALGRAASVVDANSGVRSFTYRANGTLQFDNFALGQGADETRVFTEYDLTGRKLRETSAYGQPEATLTQYAYDGLGNLTSLTDPKGNVTTFTYDKAGRVLTRTQAFGTSLAATTTFEYDSLGRSIKVTDARGNASYAYYDVLGRVTSAVDAEGYVTETAYTAFGEVQSTTRRAGKTTGAAVSAPPIVTPNAAFDAVTNYVYDKLGRVVLVIDAESHATKTAYNAFGLATSTTRFANKAAGLAAPARDAARDATTAFQYDLLARLTQTIDAETKSETFTLDSFGNRISVTNKLGGVTTNSYDNRGLLVTETIDFGSGVNVVNKYEYDLRGNLVKKREAVNEPNAIRTTIYEYDKLSRLKRTVYDAFQAIIISTDSTVTAPTVTPDELFYYDPNGNLIESRDAAGARALYWYDALNRATDKLTATGALTHTTYDANGNATETTAFATLASLPANATGSPPSVATSVADRVTQYVFDKNNRVTDVKTLGARTAIYAAGALTVTPAASPATLTASTQYDAFGNVMLATDANGAKVYSYFDRLGRKTAQIDAALYRTDWSYDALGNVLSERRYALAVAPPGTAPPPILNLQTGGDIGAGAGVVAAWWGVAGGPYAQAVETIDNAAALTLRKSSGEIFAGSAPVWGGSVVSASGDSADGRFSVVAGETIGFAFEAKQLVAGPIKVWAKLVFFNAAGAFVEAGWVELDADVWQRGEAIAVAPTDAIGVSIQYGSFRTDGQTNAPLDFAIRKLQFHKLPNAANSVPAWSPPATSSSDRVTTFAYDKMGRRTKETRSGVLVHSGTGAQQSQNAVIAYTYNELGQVATKTEASGDSITYSYDLGGRMKSEQRSGYVDYTGATVNPRVEYTYNGLNDLTQTNARGKVAAEDRITTYAYHTVGGRLLSKTDPNAFTHTYRYDKAGRVTRDEYVRVKPDGATLTEAVGYDYDLAGRVTKQGVLALSGSTWSRSILNGGAETNATAMMEYNAFGEISQRGTNDLYAEKFEYDNAGRLTRTNAGDGVWKYFMYDAVGNQTLAIATVGADFGSAALDTLSEVLALWTGGTTTIATASVAGAVATITSYDGRNQAVSVLEPKREHGGTVGIQDLITTRAYNAFGEVATEINANGARVDYSYNSMGRLIKTESPAVEGRGDNGNWITGYTGFAPNANSATAITFRPVEHRYYDASGRLVASRDANGNLSKQVLLAGTGYNGTQALVAQSIAADNATITTKYDIHGDARRIEDQLYQASAQTLHVTTQDFDRMGRLVAMNRSNLLTDYYAYDGLGQRIKHWNSFYNANGLATNEVEKTSFDQQGRIVQLIAPGGDTTSYAYAWDPNLVTKMGPAATDWVTFGGWSKTTTFANFKTLTEKTDVFERDVGKTDMSGNVTGFNYDKAGRLTQRMGEAGTAALNMSYFNTGRLASTSADITNVETRPGGAGTRTDTDSRTSTFAYDAVGNLTYEGLARSGTDWWWYPGFPGEPGWWESASFAYVYKNATASYDALGRIVSWNEVGSPDTPAAHHDFTYDANGNIRRSLGTFRALDAQGAASATATTQDYWYRYDSMNRMTTSKGDFVGATGSGSIQRGANGVDTFYDAAGQRAYTLTPFQDRYDVYEEVWDPQILDTRTIITHVPFTNTRREDYIYDAAGRAAQVSVAEGYHDGASVVLPTAPGTRRAAFSYDPMGRLLSQSDFDATGNTAVFSRTQSYNAKGQILTDTTDTLRAGVTYRAVSSYNYGTIGANAATSTYALGSPLTITTTNTTNGSPTPTTLTTNSYMWRDGPVQYSMSYDADLAYTANIPYATSYNYDIIGGQAQLKSVHIADGRVRDVNFVNDFMGQGIKRDEADALAGGDPHEIWYRFGGRQQGYVGNNGTIDTSYAQSITDRTATPGSGAFHNGAATGSSFADFDLAYDAINSYEQGSRGGTYTVQAGDTLAGIAAALWGDASLWYKLAEINGLTAERALIEGQPLLIPVGVVRNTNNASTFQPYDPLEVLGDTAPTTPVTPKPKKNKCGVLGQILMVIVAVVVSIYAPQFAELFWSHVGLSGTALAAATTVTAGAAASIASQAVGIATGVQDKFSWNAVALSALTAGVSPGGAANSWQAALNAVKANVISQGIGLATGLQKEFSWAGVAAAGVSGGIGHVLHADRWSQHLRDGHVTATALAANVGIGMARAIGAGAARSLIDGSDFGDNIVASLPDVIGQTIGDAIVGGMQRAAANRAANSLTMEILTSDMGKSRAEAERQLPSFTPVRFQDAGDAGDELQWGAEYFDPAPGDQTAAFEAVLEQGGTAAQASRAASIVAVREGFERLLLSAQARTGDMDPDLARRVLAAKPVFDAAFAAADVYNHNSIPEMLPSYMSRITNPAQLARFNLDASMTENAESGYFGALYVVRDYVNGPRFIYANRGTDNWGWGRNGDGDDNAGQGAGLMEPVVQLDEDTRITLRTADQYRQARDIARRIQGSELGHLVTYTGHSLGGGLASIQSLTTGRPTRTFNAAGIHPNSARDLGLDFFRDWSITAYNVRGERLNYEQEHAPLASGVPDAIGYRIELEGATPPRQNGSTLQPGRSMGRPTLTRPQRDYMHGMNWMLYATYADLYR